MFGPVRIEAEKVYVLLGRAIEAVGSLVFLKLLLATADTDDVGIYMLSSSVLALLLAISFSSLDQGLLRNLPEYREQRSLPNRYSSMLFSYFILSLLFSGLCCLGIWGLNLKTRLNAVVIPLSIWLICESLKNLNGIVASGLRDRALMARASLADYSFRLVLIYAAHVTGVVTPAVVLSLLAVSGAVASAVIIYGQRSLLSGFSFSTAISTLQESLMFSWPLIIWGLFSWLQNMSGRWILSHFTDLSVVATYGALTAIGTFPVVAIQGVVVAYFVPVLYERETVVPGEGRALICRVALGLVPVFGLMLVAMSLWHKQFASAFANETYVAYSFVLPLVLAGASVNAVASILTYAVYVQRRVGSLIYSNTLPGFFSVFIGYFLIARWKFYGAIFVLLFGNLLTASMYFIAFLKAGRLRGTVCAESLG